MLDSNIWFQNFIKSTLWIGEKPEVLGWGKGVERTRTLEADRVVEIPLLPQVSCVLLEKVHYLFIDSVVFSLICEVGFRILSLHCCIRIKDDWCEVFQRARYSAHIRFSFVQLTANKSAFSQNRLFGINSGAVLNKWFKICSLLYLKLVPSWVLVMLKFSAEKFDLTPPLWITLEIPCFFTSYYFLFLRSVICPTSLETSVKCHIISASINLSKCSLHQS